MNKGNNHLCLDHNAKNKTCDEPILSPLHHIFPCSWNHRLSNELPRLNVSEDTKVFFANLLFFVILVEAIPTAFKTIKTWRRWEVDDDDDHFYELKLHLAIAFLTSGYVLFYGIIISNFLLIFSSCVSLILHIFYLFVIYRILND